ncbi:MAG: VWA domain-containing protein [Acidimicrobiales bacterium]|nr:VWA domain-containing protein [Acidimicrobiales bacterium]
MKDISYPFTAIVGMDDMVLALKLLAIDPSLGGVVLSGDKGSGKSTAARSMASLLGEKVPFVELPIGVSEDRVIGSLDVTKALNEGQEVLRAGLLSEADGGVLYVDEVNLLPAHITDLLLDSSASGRLKVERDGISITKSAKFALVGSMNPEEGELRPQLLDRFGLFATCNSSTDWKIRKEIVENRIAFERDPKQFEKKWEQREQIAKEAIRNAKSLIKKGLIALEPSVMESAIGLALDFGVEGIRADITLCKAAIANCSLRGDTNVEIIDLETVAPLVLSHRAKQVKNTRSSDKQDDLKDAISDSLNESSLNHSGGSTDTDVKDQSQSQKGMTGDNSSDGDKNPKNSERSSQKLNWSSIETALDSPVKLKDSKLNLKDSHHRSKDSYSKPGIYGRKISSRSIQPDDQLTSIDLPGTLRMAGAKAISGQNSSGTSNFGATINYHDLQVSIRERVGQVTVIFIIDTSSSMGNSQSALKRLNFVKKALSDLFEDCYQKRREVAIITFGGNEAKTIVSPTASIEIASQRLEEVVIGGPTPLASGLDLAHTMAQNIKIRGGTPYLVLVTDGRATLGSENSEISPFKEALLAANKLKMLKIEVIVVKNHEKYTNTTDFCELLYEALDASSMILIEESL